MCCVLDWCAGRVVRGDRQHSATTAGTLVWQGLLKFTPFFLWRSLQGGADVAWRAFHPGMPIVPPVIDYPLRLPPRLPQVLLANIVSLLPGTLSATLDGQTLKVQVLDSRGDFMTELKALDQRVARMLPLIEPYRQRLDILHNVLLGTSFLEVIREVLRNQHDLVINRGKALPGSVLLVMEKVRQRDGIVVCF